jgi:hypothetical protein
VRAAHALERERLGHHLARAAHGAAGVEAQDDRPKLSGRADLRPAWRSFAASAGTTNQSSG